ncbi:hypothetical protein JTB14_019326 [Gonioctena quinquepunctata]|nr:hypothetical protein JTB14_019326 [Gonioctena quinquepunctata]
MRCGAPNPNRLRGTELRKQIATACKMYNLPDLLIGDVANHLGHDISIHKSIYRQSLGTEVPVIANILLKAMGSNIGESDDDECPNDGYVSGDTNRQEKSIITPDCSFATRKTQQELPSFSPGYSLATRKSQQESPFSSPGCSSWTKIRKNVRNRQNIL